MGGDIGPQPLLEMILRLRLLQLLLDGREFYSRALLDLLSLALRTEKSADTQGTPFHTQDSTKPSLRPSGQP
jgi:hypothetical protein